MILVISDLHGHLCGLNNALNTAKKLTSNISHVVLLGDYCDNGPCVPQLLDRLIELKKHDWFHPIMGNHDLMNLYNMGKGSLFGVKSTVNEFNDEWLHYFNGFSKRNFTPLQYNSKLGNNKIIEKFWECESSYNLEEYPKTIPSEHVSFLSSLPLYHKIGNYIFVHAGLNDTCINNQLAFLDEKQFGTLLFPHIPEQLKNKKIWNYSHPSNAIVVSGHCKLPNHANFVSKTRITLHAGSCNDEKLHCALLPESALVVDTNDCIFFEVDTEDSVCSNV